MVPGADGHQQEDAEDVTTKPGMSGTSFFAAVWIPAGVVCVGQTQGAVLGSGAAALLTSMSR